MYTAPVYAAAPYIAVPYVPAQQPPSSNATQVDELSYQVQRLKHELERLRDEQRTREEQQPRDARQTPPEPSPSNETPPVPVILVFRDGHQMEVSGYALVGQTLWALTEQNSSKIPLADLDLETTQKLNAERGVRLPLPRKP